jgi:hypothetical protein
MIKLANSEIFLFLGNLFLPSKHLNCTSLKNMAVTCVCVTQSFFFQILKRLYSYTSSGDELSVNLWI